MKCHNLPWDGERQLWEVIGGSETGGLLVRQGQDIKSTPYPVRLTTGSWVEECEEVGDRMHYKRIVGEGPDFGWVSIRVKAKELLVKRDGPPPQLATSSIQASEKQNAEPSEQVNAMQEEAAASLAKEAAASRAHGELEKALEASENRNADLVEKLQALQGQASPEILEELQQALEASEKQNAHLVEKLKAMQDTADANHARAAAASQAQGELEKALEASEKRNAVLSEQLRAEQGRAAASTAKELAASEARVELQRELQILKAQIAAAQPALKYHMRKAPTVQTPLSPQIAKSPTSHTVVKASQEGSLGGSTTPGQSQPCPVYRTVSAIVGPTSPSGMGHANGLRLVHPAVQVPTAGKVVSTRVIL
eukprot:TRINITY_DN3136_c0_g2_i1.p1 TRINITY_DN3136_c0_g2~~TRINITY_DN3136_c0_g2_i1.p1  ORF type:complete len:367 (+),score=91.09 TRINITY_DN3136_c0_g2_i1:93-1193(+)